MKAKSNINGNMIANNLTPHTYTHPGEILKEEIEYRGISQRKLAADMGISYTQLNEVLNGKRSVNTKLALMFEAALGINAEPLLRMQAKYDMVKAKNDKDFMSKLAKIGNIAAAL